MLTWDRDQGLLIGSKQAGVLLSMANSSGTLARDLTSFFADGMKKTGGYHSEIEYCGSQLSCTL